MSGQRIYRTLDGKHVLEGDEDAAFLAYTENDTPPKDVLEEVGGKAKKPPANKSRGKQADKSAGE